MAEVELHTYIDEIAKMIEGSSYDIAIAHCKYILGRYPKYIEAYRLIGKAALEKEDDGMALDIFQRVLAADPEDFVARVGMSIIYDRQGNLDKAIWHMERAYDLMPSNGVIQGELKRLYARRDGVEPARISLTRGALARMYTQGDLYPEAIADLNQMLAEQPDRLDLQLLLVQALWRNDQRIEAADWAQKILKQLPYCLTSNLILGEVWRADAQNVESEVPLRRAQQIDPENLFAVKFFGAASPLPEQTIMIERYEEPYTASSTATPMVDEVPDWLRGLTEDSAAPQLPGPEATPQLASGLHMPDTGPLQSEAPEWLQGLTPTSDQPAEPATRSIPAATEAGPDWLTQMRSISDRPETTTPSVDESVEVPEWLSKLGASATPSESELPPASPVIETETPDWLSKLADTADSNVPPAPAASEVEAPDWLSKLGGAEPSAPPAQPANEADMPDWLRQLGTGSLEMKSTEAAAEPTAAMPDWLANLKPPVIASDTPAAVAEPDWLSSLKQTDQPQPIESAAPSAAAPAPIEVPEEMVSPDDALAFFAKLSAGKEDQLRAQAQQEGDARMNEIMGRKAAPPAEKPAAPAPIVAAQPEPLPAPIEVPEEMVSPDDALAFLARLSAGKEDQLRAQAQQEGDARMNEIMGRKAAPATEQPVAQPEPDQPPVTPIGLSESVRQPAARLAARLEQSTPTPPKIVAPSDEATPALSQAEALAFVQQIAADKESKTVPIQPVRLSEPVPTMPNPDPGATVPIPVVVPGTPPEPISVAPMSSGQTAPLVMLPAWWWTQVADDEGEAPIAELPEPYHSPRAIVTTPSAASTATPKRERSTPVREAAPAKPGTGTLKPGTGPIAAPPIKPSVNVEPLLALLQTNANDHDARLELARTWWSSGNRDQALEHYSVLVGAGAHTDETLNDLERIVEIDDRAEWHRLLGDVCMKDGKLTRALEAYHHALEKL